MAYASRTGTRRNLDALRRAGWRLLLSPTGVLRHEGFAYCLDNGAWTYHQLGVLFDEARFAAALAAFGPGADFVITPDIVLGGRDSLALSLSWLPRVLAHTRLALIPVQDGMVAADVADLVGDRVGIFVGGSTQWKERSLPVWAGVRRATGCYLHVGRVNTARRIAICAAAGADSFDGTSASRYAVTIPELDRARRQGDLFA